MKYIVCYSGGHSSAICAIECVRRFGKENVILLNHDITGNICGVQIEDEDVKRFKQEVADYIGLPITYANSEKYGTALDVINDFNFMINPHVHTVICTYHLKTKPFYDWLSKNYPSIVGQIRNDVRIVYGFDKSEPRRVTRKVGMLANQGYQGEFPMCWNDSERTIYNTEEIGIKLPKIYKFFKHANCIGCLKAGRQHWYLVYCLYPAVYEAYAEAESRIERTIVPNISLKELQPLFSNMKNKLKIVPTEHTNPATFWAKVKKQIKDGVEEPPCDCFD